MEPHASGLLSTLVICLVAAFAGGLAVRVFRLPPLLGYVLAGIMIGPFTPGFVVNQGIASELADVGVSLLLFNIGLHFSLKDLVAVRKIALVGAVVQMTVTCSLSFWVAKTFLGCPPATAILIGLSFSTASTAIATRLLEERHQVSGLAGRIALGWSVVQDIAVIFTMVLFPILIKSDDLNANALATTLGKTILQILGFIAVILLGVRKLIPQLLGYVARIGSRELFTLSVIVIALGIAYGSSSIFGVSLALGAFFAGVVIGETDLNHHAAAEALSMQQVFSILFFVSVGMLFDPNSLVQMPTGIVTSWVAIVIGMGFVTFLILTALRIPVETAALVGGVFSQVGEITFVMSQVGHKWGVLTQNDRDLILAVAFISIVLVPALVPLYCKLGHWIANTRAYRRWHKDGEMHIKDATQSLSGHIILIGHGRVGQLVRNALSKHDVPCVTIESDRRIMEKLRKLDLSVIFGDAARETILSAARPDTARLMIVTIPGGTQIRRIVAHTKKLNPNLEIITRVHEDEEAKHLTKHGVKLAVMGEQEVALGLSAFALQFYGIESHEVLETMSNMRQRNAQPQNKEAKAQT